MADRPDEAERQEQRNREGHENELRRRRLESLQPARRADYERNQQPCYEYDNDDACASDPFTHIRTLGTRLHESGQAKDRVKPVRREGKRVVGNSVQKQRRAEAPCHREYEQTDHNHNRPSSHGKFLF